MTNYTPNDNFATVQRYDISDPVKGGATGESSLPVEQLADRTEWLNNRLGGYRGIADVTANATIDITFANKLICVAAAGNISLVLAALSSFKPGARIAITAAMTSGPFWVNVAPGGTDSISDGSVNLSNIWLYNGEMIELVAGTAKWKWTYAKGNFDKVGQDDIKRLQPRNTLIANGTLGDLRAQYPRLWAAVSGLTISDYTWNTGGLRYQAMFSDGDGATTFRRPDMRSMSVKALDLSRGVSISRLDEMSGGYEADDNKSHGHPILTSNSDRSGLDGVDPVRASLQGSVNSRGQAGPGKTIGLTGSTENTIKNIGFLPVIYY